MRSPSERLILLLTSTGLCTRGELDHCEPFVRKLSHDLPDFDSVWLDALVQQRFLTPWQADCIQADKTNELVVGRFHLQQSAGRFTFIAHETSRRSISVLRLLEQSAVPYHSTFERRLEELITAIDRSRGSAPASLVLPTEIAIRPAAADNPTDAGKDKAGQSYLVSPYVRGWSTEELLIRGGRLPASVVAEIGRELLTALTWLESGRLLHGDLVTRNVRLSPRGSVHLTSPFVRRLLQPQFALTDQLTLRDCEGIAPEQAGTGRSADARSELYALGCLLWQLLTSRPVILTADPITRLMKQKDHDIADVRGPVPDCPEWMSRIILSLTRRSPELRPTSAAEVLKHWRSHSGNSLAGCRALARSMPDHSSRVRSRSAVRATRPGSSWQWPAAAALVLGMLVFLTARSGVLPKTLRLGSLTQMAVSRTTSELPSGQKPSSAPRSPQGPIPLPAINAEGLIRLEPGQTYLADPRQFAGSLQIVCDGAPTARILVATDSQWQLKARSIELRGLSLMQQSDRDAAESDPKTRRPARQLLELQCASLAISGCVIQSPALADNFEGIAWRRPPRVEGVVMVRDTVFAGGGYGLSLNHPPRRCELENVLLANRGSGVLCEFQKGDPETWNLSCVNVTQRFGFSLLDTIVQADGPRNLQLNLSSTECVYSPQMAIVRLQGPDSMRPESMSVQFRAGETGNPAVVPPETQPVVFIDRRLQQPVSLPADQITDSSLLLAELFFESGHFESGHSVVGEVANPVGGKLDTEYSEWSASALSDFEGPKLTTVMPGIQLSRLPIQRPDAH